MTMAKSSLFACLKGDDLAIIMFDIFATKNVDSDDGKNTNSTPKNPLWERIHTFQIVNRITQLMIVWNWSFMQSGLGVLGILMFFCM